MGFGLALALLAFSHGTWVWAANFWGIAAWPLLAYASRWMLGMVARSPQAHWFGVRNVVPLLTLVVTMATVTGI